MRWRKFIIPLFLLSVPVFAQSPHLALDTLLHFPAPIDRLFYLSNYNKLYITDWNYNVHVLNCSTNAVSATLPIGEGVYPDYYFRAPAFCSRHDKMYFAVPPSSSSSVIFVVDPVGDSIVSVFSIGNFGNPMPAYNSLMDKLYISGDPIVILDCATDSVVKTIPLYWSVSEAFLVWDSVGNKVYVGASDWYNPGLVGVIDCNTDSLVAVIHTRLFWPTQALYTPRQRKLYVGADYAHLAAVIDCATNQVICYYHIGYHPRFPPAYSSIEDKVYWPSDSGVSVIDCATDSIVTKIFVPTLQGCSAYGEWNNMVYGVGSAYFPHWFLFTVDSHTDSIVDITHLAATPHSFISDIACNTVDHKIYVASVDSLLYVFRDISPGINEDAGLAVQFTTPHTSIARNFIFLSPSAVRPGERSFLLDALGRRVLELVPGENDVRGLSPGVYFISGNGNLRKVLLVK